MPLDGKFVLACFFADVLIDLCRSNVSLALVNGDTVGGGQMPERVRSSKADQPEAVIRCPLGAADTIEFCCVVCGNRRLAAFKALLSDEVRDRTLVIHARRIKCQL